LTGKTMLQLPLTRNTIFVLVRPHYPENVGAAARAIKTMGITRLALVKPGRLAVPEHEMASKMAVKAWDVLANATRFETLAEALENCDFVLTTTSRRGVSGVVSPRTAAAAAAARAELGHAVAVVLGNEKTGLDGADLDRGELKIRIPMAAAQPSINLAQASQIIAYEFFLSALAAREAPGRGFQAPETLE
jgi:TrmH family RNA methyltransferase